MARYLLIEFDNNEQADALRAQIDAATRKGKAFRVVGLFARPGLNCRCSSTRAGHVERITKTAKPVRGTRFGFYVCPLCHKPRFGNQHPTNMIAREEIIQPMVFQEIAWLDMPPLKRKWTYYPENLGVWVEPAKEN